MRPHLCLYCATCAWALVLSVVLLIMAGPTSAQPVDIPATWGGDVWSCPRLTGNWGGLRDELGKKGVVLDVDLLQTLQGATSVVRCPDGGKGVLLRTLLDPVGSNRMGVSSRVPSLPRLREHPAERGT